MLHFFQSSGKTPSFKTDLKINLAGSAIDLPQILIIQMDISAYLYALSAFRFFPNLLLFLNSKEGSLPLLTIGVH